MSILNAKNETGTPPTPAAGRSILYPKNGGWCFMDSTGAEIAISANIGEIRDYSGSSVPAGWALCEGQLLLIADYAELFSVVGNVYGGDGVTDFKLPMKRLFGDGIRSIIFTGRHPQVVQEMTVPTAIHGPTSYYKADDVLSFSVQLLDDVAITGGPVSLTIEIGDTPHTLDYVVGTAQEWLFDDYTVQSGDNGSVTATIDLNGATLSSGGISAVLSCMSTDTGTHVDTTAPVITFSDLALSVDTGSSATDFITNIAAQTITATLSDALSATEQVYGSLDDGTTWIDITGYVFNTTVSWPVTLTTSSTLKLKVVDLAGNEGSVASQAYVLDATSPTAPTVNALTTANTTPTITGTATVGAGEVLTVAVNSIAYTAGGADLTLSGTDWTLVIPAAKALTIGTYSVTATVTDTAGNATSDSTSNELVITE